MQKTIYKNGIKDIFKYNPMRIDKLRGDFWFWLIFLALDLTNKKGRISPSFLALSARLERATP